MVRDGAIVARSPGAHAAGRADVVLEDITYLSEGLAVKGILAYPAQPGPFPCVIFNRGGCLDAGMVGPQEIDDLILPLVQHGYLVVASQYRGNAGGEGREEFGGRDIQDVLALLPLLDELPQADSGRVGMWGWSRGGLMTYRALTLTARIQAAIVVSTFTDAFDYLARRPELEQEIFYRLVPDYHLNRKQALAARSAIHWAHRLFKQCPILLMHGSDDWRVHPSHAQRMADVLQREQHPHQLVMFEGADHALLPVAGPAFEEALAWLNRFVRR